MTITWTDGSQNLNYTVRQPADFVSVTPESGAEITTNDTITLTFDNPPEDVTVSEGVATISDNTVTIAGPFTPGTLEMTITWTDGSQNLNYTVRQPADFVSVTPESGAEITTNDTITLTFDNPPEDLTITWADGSQTLPYTIRPFVAFVSVDPENGAEITTNHTITLTFDNLPEDVTVSEGVAIVSEETVTITGPFTPGTLEVTITWIDGSQNLNYTIQQPVRFVSIDPTIESELTVDGTITVTFDNPPEDVTVSEGIATVSDETVTIKGPFTPGALELTITWTDGSLTSTYTVAAPDTAAPSITGGTVSDGDTDVDAEAINSSALIEVGFNEDVSGTIALQTEAGDDVGWTGTIEGNTATLEFVEGKELGPETEYVIAGTVKDAAGNETDIHISFTTESLTSGVPIEVTDANFDTVVLGSDVPIVVEFYTDW
jgi:F0F1-type ATP synthase epsilon subunit